MALLVPGDFATFCPFQSYVAQYAERSVVIPGVGAHSAAAALLKRTFDSPGVAHATVVTSPKAITRDGGEGVKLEDQYLVTENGPELLTDFPISLV